jgi:glucokinase
MSEPLRTVNVGLIGLGTVGGGVARAGDVLFDPLVKHFKEYAFRSCRETPIKAASLGNDAGIYGAVRLIVGE